jgi:hypothetical protein
MVDSTPIAQGPASRTASTAPPSPSTTWPAAVALIRPEGLAEGAATGRPRPRSTACITGCAGTRMATVGRPAETRGAMPDRSRSGRTSDIAPGQKASASASAAPVISAMARAASTFGTCTISGLNTGRPFAAKIRATARPSVASAARP